MVSELVKKGSAEHDHRSVAYYIIEVTQFDDPQIQMQMMMGNAPAAPEPRDILGGSLRLAARASRSFVRSHRSPI